LASATELCHNLILDLAAFNGMEMENMTRGRGWRFLDFGRRLERGLSVLKLVQGAVGVRSAPAAVLEPALEIADSVMTYRRQYFAAPHLSGVLNLLLREESNPRSLAFQLSVLAAHIPELVAEARATTPEIEKTRIHSLLAAVRGENLPELAVQDSH